MILTASGAGSYCFSMFIPEIYSVFPVFRPRQKGRSCMANIRDVARLANVSPATVSRILNDNQIYKTTDETRERVLRAVTELGYQAPVKKRPHADGVETSGFSVGVLLATTKGKYPPLKAIRCSRP